eukprot:TRINITY_DN3455_c0_g1_i5.p2 TRINITY_DN3455_c0_g1~~TRINITY_DN3455_c0_g1_i5.p2  ORF type:complete len:142 (-),score=31.87 TRINITY_DN3455_c0_g1_i5:60-485(-)
MCIRDRCNPHKIINFLALDKDWDPSLIFVMASALGINLITFQLILRNMEKPFFLGKFPEIKQEFDVPVIVGPIIFGIGWGISGLCPGPGMLNLFILPQGFAFIISLALGNVIASKIIIPMLTPPAKEQDQGKILNLSLIHI